MSFPNGIPSLDELKGHGRRVIESIDEKPAPVRYSLYLGPLGVTSLLLAAFVAAANAVCMQECVRLGGDIEDRLLACMDRCEVNSAPMAPTSSSKSPCEKKCTKQVGITRRQAKRQQAECVSGCRHAPFVRRTLSLIGVLALLPVVPFLGSYRAACGCECCKGQGCSAKLAFFVVAWSAYGFSVLWVLPSIAEDAGDIGGKVLFVVTQGIAIASMYASRRFAEYAEAKADEVAYRMATFGVTGAEAIGATVGPAVAAGPAVKALQDQVEQLQKQVQDLARRQDNLEKTAAKAEQQAFLGEPQMDAEPTQLL